MFYIFRFKENLEFGLDGITSWTDDGDHYSFFEDGPDKGNGNAGNKLALVAPKANLICFRVAERGEFGQNSNTEAANIERQINSAAIEQTAKSGLIEIARQEAERFVLKVEADGAFILDTAAGSQSWKCVIDLASREFAKQLVALANRADAETRRRAQEEQSTKDAAVVIRITDKNGGEPIARVKQAGWNEFLLQNGYKSVMCPVVEAPNKDYLRMLVEGDEVVLRPCVFEVGPDMQRREVSVPTQFLTKEPAQ